MPETVKIYQPSPWLRSMLGPFAWRPYLTGGFAVGVVLFVVLTLLLPNLQWSLRAVSSWNVACLWFVILVMREMRGQDGSDIKARVAVQDEGQGLILVVVVLAVAASLVGVGVELSMAKDDHGLFKAVRIAAAVATVAISWFTVQLVFALHYAHEFYAPDKTTPEDDVIGGLSFPGNQPPDYWDFVHFAVVIGVACQTADVAFTSKALRRIGTVHGVIAFTFNTVVLALTINLLAGVF